MVEFRPVGTDLARRNSDAEPRLVLLTTSGAWGAKVKLRVFPYKEFRNLTDAIQLVPGVLNKIARLLSFGKDFNL